MKPTLNLNRLNALMSWLSIFATAWLVILDKIPTDAKTWWFFGMFVLVALCSPIAERIGKQIV